MLRFIILSTFTYVLSPLTYVFDVTDFPVLQVSPLSALLHPTFSSLHPWVPVGVLLCMSMQHSLPLL